MASGILFDAGPSEPAMKYSALSLIVPIVIGSASAAVAEPPDPFEIGVPTRSVGSSNYWTYVLGPCYIPWYGTDDRHCGVRSRRLDGNVHGRATRRSGLVYRQSPQHRVAAD